MRAESISLTKLIVFLNRGYNFMDNIRKKYFITTTLFCSGCFVMFLFAYILLLSPQFGTERKLSDIFAKKKKTYQSVLEVSQQEAQNAMNSNLEKIQDKLNDFVIESEQIADLIFDISRMAKEKKVDSLNIKSQSSAGGKTIQNCSYINEDGIDLTFVGGFTQFATLLNELERHSPVIFVDQFSIGNLKQKTLEHQVNMDLAVFVKKQSES